MSGEIIGLLQAMGDLTQHLKRDEAWVFYLVFCKKDQTGQHRDQDEQPLLTFYKHNSIIVRKCPGSKQK